MPDLEEVKDTVKDAAQQISDAAREAVQQMAKDTVVQVTETAKAAVQELARDAVQQIMETAKAFAQQTSDNAQAAAQKTAKTAKGVADSAAEAVAAQANGSLSSLAATAASAAKDAIDQMAAAAGSAAQQAADAAVGQADSLQEALGVKPKKRSGGFLRFLLLGLAIGALIAIFSRRGDDGEDDFGEENWIEVKHDETGPAAQEAPAPAAPLASALPEDDSAAGTEKVTDEGA